MGKSCVLAELPEWYKAWIDSTPQVILDGQSRMRFVLDTALKNVMEKSGGPFAAAVFERDTGRLISVGMNRVVASNRSGAHAEMIALTLAQSALGVWDLGGPGLPAYELVVSGEPCAMCFGAIPWSGVRRLVTASSAREVEAQTGFDEGPVHPQWKDELTKRGIEVETGVLAAEGLVVLREYKRLGLPVYNGRQG